MAERTTTLRFRVSEDERAKIVKTINETGMSISAFLRTVSLGKLPKQVPPKEYYELMKEVRMLNENIQKLCSTYMVKSNDEFKNELNQIQKNIDKMIREVTDTLIRPAKINLTAVKEEMMVDGNDIPLEN